MEKSRQVRGQTEQIPVHSLYSAGGTSSGGAGGVTSGVITSRSSGSESISYASPSEIANGAKAWSAVYQAAGNEQEINKLLWSTAAPYLMGIRTEEGIPILYAGYDR